MTAVDASRALWPLDVVNLPHLMEWTVGRPEVRIGLIDGAPVSHHADLATESIRVLQAPGAGRSEGPTGVASTHGTYVAGILSARRSSAAPAICPGCTLLVRPIFFQAVAGNAATPSATPGELADGIYDCIRAGAQILNLSVALANTSPNREPEIEQALDYAAVRDVIVVAAAGNQGTLGGSAIIRHSSVIPVVGCNAQGRPITASNLGSSIGRRGLMAPGDGVISLGTNGQPVAFGGTSAAVPFVTGTLALLRSLFPHASTVVLRSAVTKADSRRASVVPPLLNALAAHRMIQSL